VQQSKSKITITHNDVTYELELAFGEDSILEAALDEGINLPYSCKHGICGSCMAKLMEGEVEMDECRSISPAMIDRGYILCCQSHPTTAKVVIDFDVI
jgi:ring-1,2-phenylacetyl-CoA epoxidase subunit PaaE